MNIKKLTLTTEEVVDTFVNTPLEGDYNFLQEDLVKLANAFAEKAKGQTISQVVKQLLHAHDPDTVEEIKLKVQSSKIGAPPDEIEKEIKLQHKSYTNSTHSLCRETFIKQ